ncbi:high-temperature-induced dauer-formation protein-domain-containing protein [Absidia repens]|uniref:High-temperature-induced dauer-formation protein-domain-containing protein n=1 Tax=Absidia repens TaxID=90262 RepID=A0A1X2IMZ1_9FUNG|nr:high-temperature-induced dauer-formation protein-domain-containing protein [Absidia repens]
MGATDSKLAFRKGVFRLFEERVKYRPSADDYWSCFWTLPETADEIYSLIGANDVRKTRDTAKENLETLLDKIILRIDTIVNAPHFPSTQHPPQHLLNCFRLLTRIMPYIFESPEHAEWEDAFFWTPRTVERIDAFGDDGGDESTPASASTDTPTDATAGTLDQKRIIEYDTLKLVLAVVYAIWEEGVGSSKSLGSSREMDMNRTEVLRTLTMLFSKSMYTSPSNTLAKEDLWLNYVIILVLLCSFMNTACKYDPLGWGVPYNHIMVADPAEQLVATCLRVLLILLDYRSPHAVELMHELDKHQHRQSLSTATEQLISDITTPSATESANITTTANDNSSLDENAQQSPSIDTNVGTTNNTNDAQEEPSLPAALLPTSPVSAEIQSILSSVEEINDTHDNPFKHYLSKLHRTQDFKFLMDGIQRILYNPLQASNTYLPRSTKRVQCNVEMMMLCWRLMECNQRFKNYLTETNHALDFMVVLIYFSVESKSNIAQVGVVRMCAFILQTLSSEREFGIKLNTTFTGHSSLPALARLPAFHGTYGDYLIISIVNLIASTHGGLSSLYPAFILTITNVSPYLKNLSVGSASKLITLFNSVSSAGFMLADDGNHRLTGYMLEVFNNIIQYHFANNPNVIYAVVRNHNRFEKLFKFTLSSGLAEIEHHRRLKEERQQSSTVQQANADGSQPADRQHEPNRRSSSASSFTPMYTLQKFTPTEEWVSLWFPQFPLETIQVLLNYLVPLVEEKCTLEGLTTDAQVLDFLRSVTMVGILPQRHGIFIRKFQWGEALVIWFRSMLWGQAYISSMHTSSSPWNGTLIKLFQIKHELPPPLNANGAVAASSPSASPPPPQQPSIPATAPIVSSSASTPPSSSSRSPAAPAAPTAATPTTTALSETSGHTPTSST